MENQEKNLFDGILKYIDVQDEKLWINSASEKCLKTEIKDLDIRLNFLDEQMEKFQNGGSFKQVDGVAEMIENYMSQELDIQDTLRLCIQSEHSLYELKKNDSKIWDEKYAKVVSEFEEIYVMKKSFYESTNKEYKELEKTKIDFKKTEIELKNIEWKEKRTKRIVEQLESIKSKIFRCRIVNLAKGMTMLKENEKINLKLAKLDKENKDIIRLIYEAQEASKNQQKVTSSKTSSGMTANANKLAETKKLMQKKFIDFFSESMKAKSNDDITVENEEIQKPDNLDDNISIPITDVENTNAKLIRKTQGKKLVRLPSLTSLIRHKRSKLNDSRNLFETSLNTSQTSQDGQNNDTDRHNSTIMSIDSLTPSLKKNKFPKEDSQGNQSAKKSKAMSQEDLKKITFKTPVPTSGQNRIQMSNPSTSILFPSTPGQDQLKSIGNMIHQPSLKKKAVDGNFQLPSLPVKKARNVFFAEPIVQSNDVAEKVGANKNVVVLIDQIIESDENDDMSFYQNRSMETTPFQEDSLKDEEGVDELNLSTDYGQANEGMSMNIDPISQNSEETPKIESDVFGGFPSFFNMPFNIFQGKEF